MSLKEKRLLSEDEDLEFLQSLKEDFYLETLDSLEKCEAILLEFEETQNELKKLAYKRILHSIKGSAQAVGEDRFAKVVHHVEDSISSVTNESMDFQFKFIDSAAKYIRFQKHGDTPGGQQQLEEIESSLK